MEPKSNKKGIKIVVDFGLPFAGLTLDRRALRRDFDAHVSLAQPPQGTTYSKKRDHITTTGSPTRDPTRPGPEARRIFKILIFWGDNGRQRVTTRATDFGSSDPLTTGLITITITITVTSCFEKSSS